MLSGESAHTLETQKKDTQIFSFKLYNKEKSFKKYEVSIELTIIKISESK